MLLKYCLKTVRPNVYIGKLSGVKINHINIHHHHHHNYGERLCRLGIDPSTRTYPVLNPFKLGTDRVRAAAQGADSRGERDPRESETEV